MQVSPNRPLCRVAVFESFLAAAREIGLPVEKALRSVGLPTLLQDGRELIAELPTWRFVHSVSQREGLETFGLVVACMTPYEEVSTLTPLLTGCLNLHDLLKRFCRVARLQASNAIYTLEDGGDAVWFSSRGVLLDEALRDAIVPYLGVQKMTKRLAAEISAVTPRTPRSWNKARVMLGPGLATLSTA